MNILCCQILVVNFLDTRTSAHTTHIEQTNGVRTGLILLLVLSSSAVCALYMRSSKVWIDSRKYYYFVESKYLSSNSSWFLYVSFPFLSLLLVGICVEPRRLIHKFRKLKEKICSNLPCLMMMSGTYIFC